MIERSTLPDSELAERMEGEELLWKLASPVIYAMSFVLAAILMVAAVWFSPAYDLIPGFYSFFVGPIVLVGSIVFGLCSWLLLLLENLRRPTLLDHLRRCSLVYVTLLALGLPLAYMIYIGEADAPYAFAFIAVLCAAYAILVDALVLLFRRRYSIHTNTRSLA